MLFRFVIDRLSMTSVFRRSSGRDYGCSSAIQLVLDNAEKGKQALDIRHGGRAISTYLAALPVKAKINPSR